MTWKASGLFEAGDFTAANRAYHDLLERFPGDPVAIFMLNEIAERDPADISSS